MKILRVGLTGGIAAGKSTVAGFLAELGAFVVDADEVAHQVMAPGGSAYDAVVERFGRSILDESGRIQRPELGRVVFGDAAARRDLDDRVHPHVRAEIDRRLERCAEQGHAAVGIIDAALLVETGSYHRLHRLVVVRCNPESQVRRLQERGLTDEDARARIASQVPLEQKLAVADYVIDTDRSLESTRRQTEDVWRKLLADYDERFGT